VNQRREVRAKQEGELRTARAADKHDPIGIDLLLLGEPLQGALEVLERNALERRRQSW
jgi:hypothetical protein